MGKERTTTVQTTTPKATPMEEELNRLQAERVRATQPGMIATQQAGLGLAQRLLRGEELPGYLQELSAGVTPEVAQAIAGQAVETTRPGFQALGLTDSGVAFEQQTRTAADILRGAEEFNIGTRLNLLNLALSGQAQIQQPMLSQSAMLGQRLAGLRSITSTQQVTKPNPFMSSFMGSLGKGLGGAIGGGLAGGLPGFGAGGMFSGG